MGHTWSSIIRLSKVAPTFDVSLDNASSVSQQLMTDLPPARLQLQEPAVSHVGCDYFEALLVIQEAGARSNNMVVFLHV